MKRLTLNAPAKINIGLNVVSKRGDGFHNLETFFYPLYDLHDKLIFEQSSNFIFDSNNTNLNRDPNNLILKAHTLIEDHIKKRLPVRIKLVKKIPIGAGLGGGSSDAASVLVGLNEFFHLNIEKKKLLELALILGSDVPFFVSSKPAIGYSRGEILAQTQTIINKPILIVNPGIHISTKEAFSNIRPKESTFDYNYFKTVEEPNYEILMSKISNDFERFVFDKYPDIKKIKQVMLENGALLSIMSGTGSTVYGIYEDIELANKVSLNLPSEYFRHIAE